jgi:hypothetical protein
MFSEFVPTLIELGSTFDLYTMICILENVFYNFKYETLMFIDYGRYIL